MSEATLQKLLGLMARDQPSDLRCAAARVVGELGPRSRAVDRALCAGLDDPDPAFRAEALAATGRLKIESALPQLITRLAAGGPEAEIAARAAARLGAKGVRALREAMARVAPGLRRRIAAALGAGQTTGADTAALEMLLDSDPGVVDAASRSLGLKIPSLSREQRRTLANGVVDTLDGGRGELTPIAEAALLRLLVALEDPRAENAFWQRLDPGLPAELRAAALQGLGSLSVPATRDHIKLLLTCAGDPDFRVAAPALIVLRDVRVDARTVRDWLPLFQAPDPAARRFALDKVGDLDTAEVARALLTQLAHPDQDLRKAALERLGRLAKGRSALAQALLSAATPDDAWTFARALAGLAAVLPSRLREPILETASRYLQTEDRRAEPLLFVLRHGGAQELRDALEQKATAWQSKKHFDKALVYLNVLVRDPGCGEATRFEAAACALKQSPRDLAAESRAADPALEQFARLLHRGEGSLSDRVFKAKWLGPEDLFYLGFHFTEGDRQGTAFGAEVLRLLAKRWPKSKHARDAKHKLRSQGLS